MNIPTYYALITVSYQAGYPNPIERTIMRIYAVDYCFAWNEI